MSVKQTLCIFGILVCGQVAAAQIPAASSCPIGAPVSIQIPDVQTGSTKLSAVVTNLVTEPISAVILDWRLTFASDIVQHEFTTVDLAPSGGGLLNGKTTTEDDQISAASAAKLQSIDVNCTAVFFSSGRLWGDGKSHAVERLKALRSGERFERQRLLLVYQTKGLDQLLIELKRPMSH